MLYSPLFAKLEKKPLLNAGSQKRVFFVLDHKKIYSFKYIHFPECKRNHIQKLYITTRIEPTALSGHVS